MNREAAQEAINNIVEKFRSEQPVAARKQYPASKKYLSERVIKSVSIPQWLADDVDALQEALGVTSWSAAGAMLLAYGLHQYTLDYEPDKRMNLDEFYGVEFEQWCDETGANHNDMERYLLEQLMPQHGGKRDGAGWPKGRPRSED